MPATPDARARARGDKIRTRRQELGWTQDQLAARVQAIGTRQGQPISRSTVQKWENGTHAPLRHAGALEKVLGIRLSEENPDPELSPDVSALVMALKEELDAGTPGERRQVMRLLQSPTRPPEDGDAPPVRRPAR